MLPKLTQLEEFTACFGIRSVGDAVRVKDGIIDLLACPELREICLDDMHITDAGVRKLLRFPKLRKISLNRTGITHAAFDIFDELPELEEAAYAECGHIGHWSPKRR